MEEYESQRASRSNKTRTTTETYSPERMAKLKRILEMSADDGEPKYYSIHVDGMPIVEKTTDLDRFETYMTCFDHTTRLVELRMFYGSSPNCNTFFLYVGGQQPSLQGVPQLGAAEIGEKINEAVIQAVSQERMHSKIERLESEVARLTEANASLTKKLKKYKKLEEEARAVANDKTEQREMIKTGLGVIAPLIVGKVMPGAGAVDGLPQEDHPPPPPPPVEIEIEREQSEVDKHFEAMKSEYSEPEISNAIEAIELFARHPELRAEFEEIITKKQES